jgi:predicted dinucleotide-binding enzyme
MSQLSWPRLGFVGAGRIARCLALGFARAGYPVTAIASRTPESARRLASQIEFCAAYDEPQRVVESADILFLTVADDSIGTTANTPDFSCHTVPPGGA